MPTVRYTADGGRYRVAGQTLEPEATVEVASGLAERLVDDVGTFEYVDVADGAPDASDPDDAGDTGASTSAADSDSAEPPADEPGGEGGAFDVDQWLDRDYTERADRVRAGDVDAHLEEIADAERSDTVLDAIGERRAEITTQDRE